MSGKKSHKANILCLAMLAMMIAIAVLIIGCGYLAKDITCCDGTRLIGSFLLLWFTVWGILLHSNC